MVKRWNTVLTLFELIPSRELHLPASKIVRGSQKQDMVIEDAIARALGHYPAKSEAAIVFCKLFEHAVDRLSDRQHSRPLYWRAVTEGWQEACGVVLDVDDVRNLVLCITRAERIYNGVKEPEPTEFLSLVRKVNEYMKVNEPLSDEAVEFFEQVKVAEQSSNAFHSASFQPIPWEDIAGPVRKMKKLKKQDALYYELMAQVEDIDVSKFEYKVQDCKASDRKVSARSVEMADGDVEMVEANAQMNSAQFVSGDGDVEMGGVHHVKPGNNKLTRDEKIQMQEVGSEDVRDNEDYYFQESQEAILAELAHIEAQKKEKAEKERLEKIRVRIAQVKLTDGNPTAGF